MLYSPTQLATSLARLLGTNNIRDLSLLMGAPLDVAHAFAALQSQLARVPALIRVSQCQLGWNDAW